jgi:hypothetical protein
MQHIKDRLNSLWLAEAVKQKERTGAIDDSLALSQLAQSNSHTDLDDEALICLRAKLLSLHNPVTEPLPRQMHHLLSIGKFALLIVTATAFVSGVTLAWSVLLQGNRLNVLLVMAFLLVPHLLGLLWMAIVYARLGSSNSLIAEAWEWLIGRIGRRQNATLLMEAIRSMLGSSRNLPLMLFSISHFWWILFALSTMLTMYLHFSVDEYMFTWGTTILQPETFHQVIKAMGWLPGLIGFPQPEGMAVMAADDTPEIRRTWAYFIFGCLTVYALLPRLLMLGYSLATVRTGLRRLSLPLDDTYYINTLGRIRHALQRSEIVDPDLEPVNPTGKPEPSSNGRGDSKIQTWGIVPFELRATESMSLSGRESGWQVFSNVVDGPSQDAVVDAIKKHGINSIVMVFDARNTADRGAFQFLRQLRTRCNEFNVALLYQDEATPNKLFNWQEGLKEVGVEILDKLPLSLSSKTSRS